MTQPISGSDIEQHVPLTDVVLMLYLEEIPQVSEGPSGEPIYEAEALRKASAGAFTMGCAIGMDFPDLVRPILEQTHSDEGAVERRAALLVRNDFNRKQAEQVEAMERGEEPFPVLGPDPNRPIQDTAKELVTAYQADIGFSDVDGL
jgi:hypothetical protein